MQFMTVLDKKASRVGAVADGVGTEPAVSYAEDLRRLSDEELMALFQKGSAPGSVRAVEGHPAGVAIALSVFSGGRVERWLRRYSQSDRFVWHGKSFESISDAEGWGWNRLGVGPTLAALPFRTFVGPSRNDGAPTLVLDYDVAKNPWWLRPIWDELREVIPGVFMGTVGLRILGRHHRMAWFAVDTSRRSPLSGV